MRRGDQRRSPARNLRRVARAVAEASAHVSAPLRMRPEFLIVGAQRCGTTSMFKAIVQHPLVARPFLRKGVHYFDTNYGNGFGWYRGNFPIAASSWARRAGRGQPHTGESSPYYMFHPLAGERIAAHLPDIRLLALLRDPVERAYSAHSHELARGYEAKSFEAALELEDERLAGERERMRADPTYQSHSWQHHAYLRRGQYIDQLTALEQLVGSDRLLVIDSHDLFTSPESVMPQVWAFLGLPDGEVAFARHNARPRAPMAESLRRRLDDHFVPYDEKLAAWWGRTPSWRR